MDQVPENATAVYASDPRIRDVEPIQSTLETAMERHRDEINRSELASVRVEGQEFAETRSTMEAVPGYKAPPDRPYPGWGSAVVRTDGALFVIQFWIES